MSLLVLFNGGEEVAGVEYDFGFSCRAKSEGFAIEVSYTYPAVGDDTGWDRRLVVMRKLGEWPNAWNDPGATTVIDATYAGPAGATVVIEQTGLEAGQTYYYALFSLDIDTSWRHLAASDRCSSYPYGRWGACDYLYQSLPRGYRSEDVDEHLYQFVCILGALLDDTKTDTENILALFEIDNVHADLLFLLDRTIGWPTWNAAGALQRRKETTEAADLYKILGRRVSYEQILEEISNWSVDVVEGWRYVMFSNGVYGSTTPDMTDPDLQRLYGRIDDKLKYTNDSAGWHAMAGLGFFMSEIEGVSEELDQVMLDRFSFMIDWGKASYVTTNLAAQPITEEIVLPALDDYDEIQAQAEVVLLALDELLPWETGDAALFLSLTAGSTTNNLGDRTVHVDLDFV